LSSLVLRCVLITVNAISFEIYFVWLFWSHMYYIVDDELIYISL
jgi:hypothetical protein